MIPPYVLINTVPDPGVDACFRVLQTSAVLRLKIRFISRRSSNAHLRTILSPEDAFCFYHRAKIEVMHVEEGLDQT